METFVLKRNIQNLKTTEIVPSLNRWKFLRAPEVENLKSTTNFKKTKRSAAVEVVDFCNNKGGLTQEKVGEYELICVQICSTKKQWSAYQLTEKQGKSKAADVGKSPGKFKTRLTRLLKLYFSNESCVSVMLYNGLLWGRVYLPKSGLKSYQPTRCLYFVYYPQTPVMVISGMKVAFDEFVSQCLVVALGYKSLVEMSLTGHHMESVAELAINKISQGGYTRFQQTQRPNGPLNDVTSKKRKAPDDEAVDGITDENHGEKRQRLEILDEGFGEFIQPSLEKLEYRVELPYRSKDITPELRNDGQIFHSQVQFRGKSVLEGLRNLGTTGYAKVPLPKHLMCVPSRARNYFLLAKPQKPNNTHPVNDQSNSQSTSGRGKSVASKSNALKNRTNWKDSRSDTKQKTASTSKKKK